MVEGPDVPDFFTVEEAARILRIGRTAAYELARSWRETNGERGLPVVAFGRLLRVPRSVLETMSGGPVNIPAPVEARVVEPEPPRPEPPSSRGVSSDRRHPGKRRRSRSRPASPNQTSFPFE